MGRITIFSADGCPHSRRSKVELQNRGIPFVEISVTRHTARRKDMMALSNRLSTPQIFFNTRHVGGADDVIKLLKEWDEDKSRYKTAFERYQVEIEQQFDPSNPRFAIPEADEEVVTQENTPPRLQAMSIQLPTGGKESVLKVTETLKTILPRADNVYKMTMHKMSFSGIQFVNAVSNHYHIDTASAIAFGRHLQAQKVIHHVRQKYEFDNTERFFRLQCDEYPAVLNSYRVWTEDMTDPSPMRLLRRLTDLMRDLEMSAVGGDGEIDYKMAQKSKLYPVFEEAACELQKVDVTLMNDQTKTAFGINLYNLMIKYAFMKLGAGLTDFSRLVFYNNVCFEVGGHVFSFQDWEHGILRGNRKAPHSLGPQFGKQDPRRHLAVKQPDMRIHFGLNCGAKSCPPVNHYTVEDLDEELGVVASSFCEEDDNVFIDVEKREIKISKIFSWYRMDFVGSPKELPRALVPYLRGVKKQELERMLDQKESIKVSYMPYNWAANAKGVEAFAAANLKTDVKTVRGIVQRRSSTHSKSGQFSVPFEESDTFRAESQQDLSPNTSQEL